MDTMYYLDSEERDDLEENSNYNWSFCHNVFRKKTKIKRGDMVFGLEWAGVWER